MKGEKLLSIVILANDEGFFAHKTMRCLFDSLNGLGKKTDYEIIVHLKNADDITKAYFSRYSTKDKVILVDDASEKISGEFLMILESGAIFSNNTFKKIIEQGHEDEIFLPKYIINDGKNLITNNLEETSEKRNLEILLGKNLGSNFCCHTDLVRPFLKYIFKENNSQRFWFEINNSKIQPKILLDTTFFCHKEEKENTILPKSVFKYSEKELKNNKETVKKNILKKVYINIRNNRYAAKILDPIGKKINKIRKKDDSKQNRVPTEVYEHWIEANKYDSNLYPSWDAINNLSIINGTDNAVIVALNNILAKIKNGYDYVFMVPWIVRGGGDKVLLNYVKALKEIFPKLKILVISTEASRGEWVRNLPNNVDYVDFGKYRCTLPYEYQNKIMERIIIQSQTKKIHIINSGFAYDWIYAYKDFLKKNHYEIYVSFFCYDFVPDTQYKWLVEFSDPYIIKNYDLIKKIFTDNRAIVDFDIERNGFDPAKFSVHYQPICDQIKEINSQKRDKVKILWAGRIADQKIPCVLKEIGKNVNPDKYQIDVYGYIYDNYPKNYFSNCAAISYKGEYDGFTSLNIEEYDMLLYTSIIDGLPNVLLEAVAAGLPIVASNSGGIKELIVNKESGLLVDDIFEAQEYIDAIIKLGNDPGLRVKYAKNAQEIIKKRHSWNNFVETVKKEFKK